jgi:hypothetical protein
MNIENIPFTPYLQVFIIVFQTILLFLRAREVSSF